MFWPLSLLFAPRVRERRADRYRAPMFSPGVRAAHDRQATGGSDPSSDALMWYATGSGSGHGSSDCSSTSSDSSSSGDCGGGDGGGCGGGE